MGDVLNKIKIKIELQTFVVVLVFVFGLGGTFISLKSTQQQILVKLDELAVQQELMITKRDNDHELLGRQIGWLMPTMEMVLKKIGL